MEIPRTHPADRPTHITEAERRTLHSTKSPNHSGVLLAHTVEDVRPGTGVRCTPHSRVWFESHLLLF